MRGKRLEDMGYAVAAALTALAFALISIRAWDASLGIPFEYYWDSLFFESQIKGVIDHGSPFFNPDLGSPFGQDSVDFFQGGVTTYFAAWVLGLFTNSWAAVVNLIWLGGFPLVALVTWWALARLGVPRFPALVAAVAFAILPYHFWRGESHLILSGYLAVPLGGYLALKVLRGDSLFNPVGRADAMAWFRSISAVIGICLIISLSAVYYSIFSIIILGLASLLALLVPNRRKSGLLGLLAVAVIGIFTLASFAPSVAFRAENGTNPEAGAREARESDYYGLSVSQMLLPATNHRWQDLADVKQRFLSESITPSEDAQSLGILGTLGFVICLVGLLLLPPGRPKWIEPLIPESGVAILLALLVGSIGGFAILFAIFVTPQVRAWNRISVFVAFFALVGFAVLLGRLFSLIEERSGTKAPTFLLGSVLMVFALWDQTPARWPEQFRHDLIQREFESDQALVSRMESVLPSGAQIFQIPYLKYPEGYPAPGQMDDFDPLRGYLHSSNLRWSYGAIKGRAADISFCVRNLEIPRLIKVIQAWGFSALWIDSAGYPDSASRRIISEAEREAESMPIEDRSGRFKVFMLRSGNGLPKSDNVKLRKSLPDNGAAAQDCRPIRRGVSAIGI